MAERPTSCDGKNRWDGRVAVVTGASSGIGYSVAKSLVQRGMKVVGCARNVEPIQKLSDELSGERGKLWVVKCDVSKEDEIAAMFQTIRNDPDLGRVDVLINNAGLAHDSPLLTGDSQQWRHMFDVNVLGLMMCTKEAFALMREKKIDDGHIILVNSMSGIRMVKNKGGHCYAATKFAVTAIREGIRNELRELKSNIRISQVCPGFVETDFVQRHFNSQDHADQVYTSMKQICPGLVETEFTARLSGEQRAKQVYSSMKCLQSEDIKDAILYMLDAPPHVEINDVHLRPTEQVF